VRSVTGRKIRAFASEKFRPINKWLPIICSLPMNTPGTAGKSTGHCACFNRCNLKRCRLWQKVQRHQTATIQSCVKNSKSKVCQSLVTFYVFFIQFAILPEIVAIFLLIFYVKKVTGSVSRHRELIQAFSWWQRSWTIQCNMYLKLRFTAG